jgi:ATP-dependent Clp protease adaptor protein ClpS
MIGALKVPDGMVEREVIEREPGVVTESEKKLKAPPLYKVLLHNDDYTTMEFVVEVLQSVFHHPPAQATQIMLHVHRSGIGVAGVYTYEIAETKCSVVEAMARRHEFPLKCSMEPA